MQKIYCIMETLLSGNQNSLSHPNEQRFLPGPKQSSPELTPQLSAWPWTGCFTFLPPFLNSKLEGSDASHVGCWEDPVDNEPCCPLVLTTAGAVQRCSHAQHQRRMGKMWSCWMCSCLPRARTYQSSLETFPLSAPSPKLYLFSLT